ncbi:MAG: sigma-E processing peptidase SpoIIGA [Ignavibacteriales bacterium]
MGGYIYGDILFLVNFVMNSLILWGTSRFAGASVHRARLALAAALGSAYSLMAAWLDLPVLESIPVKAIVAAGMVGMAFRPRGSGQLIRLTGYFLSMSFLAAGATMAVWAASWGPRGWVYPLRWWALAVAVALAVAGSAALSRHLRSRRCLGPACMNVEIAFGGLKTGLTAFVDTGNRLEDPVTGEPVLVAEYDAVKGIIPPGVRQAIAAGDLIAVAGAPCSSFASRIRVLPFSTLGEARGLMVGFRPDSVVVECDGRRYSRSGTVVAVCRGPLSPEGSYQALLNPCILEGIMETG